MLDIVKTNEGFTLFELDLPKKTSGGRVFCSPDQRLLKHIATHLAFLNSSSGGGLNPLDFLEFQIDQIDVGGDPLLQTFSSWTEKDAYIALKIKKKNSSAASTPSIDLTDPLAESLLNLLFWGTSAIVLSLNQFIADHIQVVEDEPDIDHPFILLLKQEYLSLSHEKRAVVNCLSRHHDSGVVLPLLFVIGRITSSEYARGVIAAKSKNGVKLEEYPGSLERVFTDATIAADYLAYYSTRLIENISVLDLIKGGESDAIEFKSTFRWDLKANKTNNAIERASLKTIAGFLNSMGGTLLIGVRDDGSTEGIESDRFPNEDKFLLHLWTLIRTSLGRDVSPYIKTTLEKREDKTICIVQCSRSPQPVFLRQPGFDEEFYIRVGPSSNALDISEALRYIAKHY